MQQSAFDSFTRKATTGTPAPRSTPNASTSNCEAAGAMTRFCLFQLRAASQTRVANSPFLAAPTCTLTPVRNSALKSPAPSLQITSWRWAWQTLAVPQKRKGKASAAAPRRNRTGALGTRSDGRFCEFSRGMIWAYVGKIFAIGSNLWLAPIADRTVEPYPSRAGEVRQNSVLRFIRFRGFRT